MIDETPHCDEMPVFEEKVSFGSFHLYPAKQLLLDGKVPVRIGSRAYGILVALLERPGELVGKGQLIAKVWPHTYVEEANLKVHVAALRKLLGDGQAGKRFIVNVPGRGYRFVALTTKLSGKPTAEPAPEPAERTDRLPAPLARMVGRSDIVASLARQLDQHRFVTIVGPGGIGKTTVALAVADATSGSFKDGIQFLDLAPVRDPAFVPSALASAFGAPVHSDNPVLALVSLLKHKRVLIVLDSCEHVIDAVANLAESVFKGSASVHILATSREPLRIEGERVHRLSPLAAPSSSVGMTAAKALAFSAVQLFVERAGANVDTFELTDADAPNVADICRRLDGIALAIEIAAGRVDSFGIAGLAALLDDRFKLEMRGRRTALSRHQTLNTTLDWSHALLPESERVVLRRLAVFAGTFTLKSASAILAQDDLSAASAFESVANLVAKSLVSVNYDGGVANYRLLDMTRAYATRKLSESGELDLYLRRHAEHFADLLAQAGREWRERPATEWLADHRHIIDNLRSALEWAFSPQGDPRLSVALTIASEPLWFQLSLLSEASERIERVLALDPSLREPRDELALQAARAWSLMQTRGSVPETTAAWTTALQISERLGDIDIQLRSMWGLWAGLLNKSKLRDALELAEKFCELAEQNARTTDLLVGDRMVGYILHLLGDQTAARRRIEHMLALYDPPATGAQVLRFVFDQRATARCFLARILWLQGFPDQAMAAVDDIVESALKEDDVLSLCQVLVQAGCPVCILVGDIEKLARFVDVLLDRSEQNALEFWQAWGRCFKGVLLIRSGRLSVGLTLLRAALANLRDIEFGVYYVVFMGEFAEASGRAGYLAQASVAVDEALARCERNEERWYKAELLRIKGDLALRRGGPDASAEGERYLLESLEFARQGEMLSWELRTALSLCRLWVAEHRGQEARSLLQPLWSRFSEGFATEDLRAAKAMLSELD